MPDPRAGRQELGDDRKDRRADVADLRDDRREDRREDRPAAPAGMAQPQAAATRNEVAALRDNLRADILPCRPRAGLCGAS
jgi:hypothetical protein